MELRHYLTVLLKRWPILLVTFVLAIAVAAAVTPRTSLYTAEATIVVGPRQYQTGTSGADGSSSAIISADQAVGISDLLQTYADLIPTTPIATAAIQTSGVARSTAQVAGETKAIPVADTQLLLVQVTDTVPLVAQQLSTDIANAFVNKVNSYTPSATEGSLPQVPVYVFQPASLPTVPHGTGLERNVIVAAIFGLLVAMALVALAEYVDITVKNAEDAERRVALPVLGTIPYYTRAPTAASSVSTVRSPVSTAGASLNGHG